MKLKPGRCKLVNYQGELLLQVDTDTGRPKGVRLDETGRMILGYLRNDTTIDEIVAKLSEKVDASDEILRATTENVIDTLRKLGAIA